MHTILRGVDSGKGARDWRSAIRQSHIQPAQYALLLRYRRAGVPAATSALKAEWAAIARDLLDKTRSLCAPMVVDGRSASSLAADHRSRAGDDVRRIVRELNKHLFHDPAARRIDDQTLPFGSFHQLRILHGCVETGP